MVTQTPHSGEGSESSGVLGAKMCEYISLPFLFGDEQVTFKYSLRESKIPWVTDNIWSSHSLHPILQGPQTLCVFPIRFWKNMCLNYGDRPMAPKVSHISTFLIFLFQLPCLMGFWEFHVSTWKLRYVMKQFVIKFSAFLWKCFGLLILFISRNSSSSIC